MKALIAQTVTVPAAAGGQPSNVKIKAHGKYFFAQQATGPFQLQFDAGLITTPQVGMQLSGSFQQLTFFNSGAAAIMVTFYVSQQAIEGVAVFVAQVANSLATCVQAVPAQVLRTVAAAGTPVAFAAAAGTFARQIICIPQKTVAPVTKGGSANAGNVYVGVAGTTANTQPLPLLPGAVFVFQADTGAKFDLSSFSLDADNSGDGVVLIYW
jgi:hypothetical protein